MTLHVSLDLETLSLAPNAFILSIGAARFDPFDDGITDSFHVAIDLNNVPEHLRSRFDLDPATIGWWLDADRDEARKTLRSTPKADIASALEGFNLWFGVEPVATPVWGNGATFDNVVIAQAFKACGMELPWTYKADRDLRTLKALAPEIEAKPVVAHSALDDAIAQALQVQEIVAHLHLTTI